MVYCAWREAVVISAPTTTLLRRDENLAFLDIAMLAILANSC
jgi:hypothetical protein